METEICRSRFHCGPDRPLDVQMSADDIMFLVDILYIGL
jgi:hypothetical protein